MSQLTYTPTQTHRTHTQHTDESVISRLSLYSVPSVAFSVVVTIMFEPPMSSFHDCTHTRNTHTLKAYSNQHVSHTTQIVTRNTQHTHRIHGTHRLANTLNTKQKKRVTHWYNTTDSTRHAHTLELNINAQRTPHRGTNARTHTHTPEA